MKKLFFTLGLLFITHQCSAMQPQGPTLQNKTVIIPAVATGKVVSTPTWIQPGTTIGGVPPYSYALHGANPTNEVTFFNGKFIVTPLRLPFSFDYVAIDSLGHQSQPATITIEGGSNIQEATPSFTEVMPG